MKIKNVQKKKREGFTLVEMVLVVTILGTLSGIGFMKFGKVQETSRKNADYVAAANLATATNLYINEHPKAVEFNDPDEYKNISIEKKKKEGYINYEPTSQSEGEDFIIELSKNGEIYITSNNTKFYPKEDDTETK